MRPRTVDLYKGKRICKVCNKTKDISEFYLMNHKSVRSGKCKTCYNKKVKIYRQKNQQKYQDWNRVYHLEKKYKLTKEDFSKLRENQKNQCAVCQTELTDKLMVVDHNHKTGNIRGLLCRQCNFALGLLKDNIIVLKRAITYLT